MKRMILFVLVLFAVTACATEGMKPRRFARPNGNFTDVNGVITYYETMGPEDGEPVVLLHGFGASAFTWRYTMPALADAGYYVIAFDRPGFGLSQKPADFDYSHISQAEHTAALLDQLAIEQAVMVGHSQGGNILSHYVQRYPERVERMVIVAGAILSGHDGTMGGVSLEPAGSIWLSALAAEPYNSLIKVAMNAVFSPDLVAELVISTYGDPSLVTEETIEGYVQPFYTAGWDTALLEMIIDSAGNSLDPASLATVDKPTLILWGKADTWVPVQNGLALHKILPNDTLILYPRVGHLPMEEIPQRFNTDLLTFLQRR